MAPPAAEVEPVEVEPDEVEPVDVEPDEVEVVPDDVPLVPGVEAVDEDGVRLADGVELAAGVAPVVDDVVAPAAGVAPVVVDVVPPAAGVAPVVVDVVPVDVDDVPLVAKVGIGKTASATGFGPTLIMPSDDRLRTSTSDTLFEPLFVTKAEFPSAVIRISVGSVPTGISLTLFLATRSETTTEFAPDWPFTMKA